MTSAEAVRLIAMLGAYYSREIGTDTAGLWAKSLVEFEVEDGMEAVQLLGASGRYLPTLADLVDTIRECRVDRLKHELAALPPQGHSGSMSFETWIKTTATDDEKATLLRVAPKLSVKYGITLGESA